MDSETVALAVSVLALLISALAPLYARWQALSSMHANHIALHQDRLMVYNALRRFAAHLTARGPNFEEAEVWRFQEAADQSEFYFDASMHKALTDVVQRALKVLSLNDEWLQAKLERLPNASELVAPRHEFLRTLRADCYSLSDRMRSDLRVHRER